VDKSLERGVVAERDLNVLSSAGVLGGDLSDLLTFLFSLFVSFFGGSLELGKKILDS
jgi:hypothetical protein